MINIALSGASGRMGGAIIREISSFSELKLVHTFVSGSSEAIGQNAVEHSPDLKFSCTDNATDFDVLIDFSSPSAVEENLAICTKIGAGILVGTTGLNDHQNQLLSEAAQEIPVIYAANTSIGVNLCVSLIDMASKVLGDTADIEVVECHHRNKVDAPSGTALLLGEAAANALGKNLDECGTFARQGHTGPRASGTIGFSTVRGGDVAGEHTVMFIGESERIEITHRATDRKIFARGALKAACWLSSQKKGLYGMQDVLDLR